MLRLPVRSASATAKIMLKHILPNCIPSLIVLFTLNVPSAILSESSLSFLGIGAQPPAASWGLMVNQSKQFFVHPALAGLGTLHCHYDRGAGVQLFG